MTADTPSRSLFWAAFWDSVPVFVAYFPLAIVFGVVWEQAGLPPVWGMIYSVTIYAGAVQFLALPFILNGGSIWAMLLAVFPVAMRNSFYTLALLDLLPKRWAYRLYSAFALVDVPFAILLSKPTNQARSLAYMMPLFGLVHAYWALGTAVGVWVGTYVPNEFEALGFALPALLAALALDQQRKCGRWRPVIIAAAMALIFRVFWGEGWLLPGFASCVLATLLTPTPTPAKEATS